MTRVRRLGVPGTADLEGHPALDALTGQDVQEEDLRSGRRDPFPSRQWRFTGRSSWTESDSPATSWS